MDKRTEEKLAEFWHDQNLGIIETLQKAYNLGRADAADRTYTSDQLTALSDRLGHLVRVAGNGFHPRVAVIDLLVELSFKPAEQDSGVGGGADPARTDAASSGAQTTDETAQPAADSGSIDERRGQPVPHVTHGTKSGSPDRTVGFCTARDHSDLANQVDAIERELDVTKEGLIRRLDALCELVTGEPQDGATDTPHERLVAVARGEMRVATYDPEPEEA